MNDFWTAFSALAAALTLIGGAYAFGRTTGYKQATRDLNNERDAKRFSEIYAPLMGLFTMCHITTATGRGAPYLRQRCRNAWRLLRTGQLIQAALALFDEQELGVSGEVEYGSSFPLHSITKHLQGREQFSDPALITLVARANRAQYEDHPNDNELTQADLALFEHICEQHEVLSHRFAGA